MPRTGSDWDAAEALMRVLADTDALIVKDERSFRCNGLRNSADLSWDAVERVLKGKYDSKVRAASSFLPQSLVLPCDRLRDCRNWSPLPCRVCVVGWREREGEMWVVGWGPTLADVRQW